MAGIEQVRGVGGVLNGQIGHESQRTLSRLALLRGNHHHAVGTARTINSGSRGILEHVETFHIGHVEAVKSQVCGHTVNHHQRVAIVDGAQTADLERNVVARLACVHHLESGYLTLDSLSNVGHRTALHIFGSK